MIDNKKLAAYLKKSNKTESLFLQLKEGALFITDRFGLFRVEYQPKELAKYWPESDGMYRIAYGGGTMEEWGHPDLVKYWERITTDPTVHTLNPTRWGYYLSGGWYRKFTQGEHKALINTALTDLFDVDPDYLNLHYKYEQIEYQTAIRVLEHRTDWYQGKGQVDTYTPTAVIMPLCNAIKED